MSDNRTPIQRFEELYEPEPNSGCWLWLGHLQRGYARFRANGRKHVAHRWSWEHVNGPVPEGLQLDHLCRRRACVNPSHLEPVTARENNLRGASVTAANARQTHCRRGHAFTADNTYTFRNSRVCRECRREYMRAYVRRAA